MASSRVCVTRMCCCTSALARDGGAQWLHVDYEEDLEPFFRGRGFRPTPAGLLYLRQEGT